MEPLSVLVCTRDRPFMLVRLLRSLIASGRGGEGGQREVIVVDQSEAQETTEAVARLGSESVRYVRSRSRGKGAALNEGLALARSEIVVLTDDDCEAPPGWPEGMAATLGRDPSAGVLFCRVEPTPGYDSEKGYIPAHLPTSSRTLQGLPFANLRLGLGAGMAVRADVARLLGGFDEAFGPGAIFPSCDDWDLATRALLLGWHVAETAEWGVTHHGFRSYGDGREHTRRDWIAIGALGAKFVRARRWRGAAFSLSALVRDAAWPPLREVMRLRRPKGALRITSFARGFSAAMRLSVDRDTLRFRSPIFPDGAGSKSA